MLRRLPVVPLVAGVAQHHDVRGDFGDFVMAVCTAVARAHEEGGVLGFGGKPVSAAEQAALDQIATELGPRP